MLSCQVIHLSHDPTACIILYAKEKKKERQVYSKTFLSKKIKDLLENTERAKTRIAHGETL